MILRAHTRPDGRTVTLARNTYGYRIEVRAESTIVRALDLAPRSRALAFEHFLTWASASGNLGALYPEILDAVARAAQGQTVARQRSLADGVLGCTHRSNEEGAAAVARALSRMADVTSDPTIAGLAARVHSLHAAALLALPEAVRAPLAPDLAVTPC